MYIKHWDLEKKYIYLSLFCWFSITTHKYSTILLMYFSDLQSLIVKCSFFLVVSVLCMLIKEVYSVSTNNVQLVFNIARSCTCFIAYSFHDFLRCFLSMELGNCYSKIICLQIDIISKSLQHFCENNLN